MKNKTLSSQKYQNDCSEGPDEEEGAQEIEVSHKQIESTIRKVYMGGIQGKDEPRHMVESDSPNSTKKPVIALSKRKMNESNVDKEPSKPIVPAGMASSGSTSTEVVHRS